MPGHLWILYSLVHPYTIPYLFLFLHICVLLLSAPLYPLQPLALPMTLSVILYPLYVLAGPELEAG